jgi:hypothetical protein
MSTNLGDDRAAERHWIPTTLVVVATVIAVISAVTTWVHSQALDTDDWVDASSELIDDPDIQQALANYLIGELYTNVDVSAELERVLPDALSGLAGPISGALRDPATEGLEKVIASPQFGKLWADANRLAHRTFVAILRDETPPALSTSDGEVVLDLKTALENAASSLGLPGALVDRLPDDAGQIVIFSSSELADAQTTVKTLDFLSWFTFILVVVLYALWRSCSPISPGVPCAEPFAVPPRSRWAASWRTPWTGRPPPTLARSTGLPRRRASSKNRTTNAGWTTTSAGRSSQGASPSSRS